MINLKILMVIIHQEYQQFILQDESKNHNFRGSFQTGFRNPTTQDQYIGLMLEMQYY
jgi:hypothetical protein